MKILSADTSSVTLQWISSNHTCGSYKFFASLASLSATLLPWRLVWVKVADLNVDAREHESSIMCPNAVVQGCSAVRSLKTTSESPSKTTSCSPSSFANTMDLLQANASKAATVGGRWIRSDNAAMTKPSESRTTSRCAPTSTCRTAFWPATTARKSKTSIR